MRRLISYLFLIFGFLLFSNINAEAQYYCVSKNYESITDAQLIKLIKNYNKTKNKKL